VNNTQELRQWLEELRRAHQMRRRLAAEQEIMKGEKHG
jgi:hypothetical protein